MNSEQQMPIGAWDRLSDEAVAAKEMLTEHLRGRGGLVPALMQYRQQHPDLSFEDAILGLFTEVCR
jgi:hypothetical protein